MTYNTKTIRNALSVARGVSLELVHDALAALAEIERAEHRAHRQRAELDRKLNNYILIGEAYSRRAVKAEAERDALRADIADIAELDARIAELEESIEGDLGWRATEQRWKLRAERAEAELARLRVAAEIGESK